MSIADKLTAIADNQPKVYEAGKLAVLKDSKYMNASVSGAVVAVNDVNPIEHDVDVKLKSNRNLYNAQITQVAEWDGATSADNKREFKEGVWYVGLTGNNYWNPKQITNYSTREGAVTFTATLALYGMSQAFKCQPQQKYYFSCETSEQLAEDRICWFGFYDADGGYIHFARWDASTGYIITPNNCYWVTVCPCGSPNVAVTYSNIQLSTEPIDSYTPYPDLSVATVKQYGKNLLDINGYIKVRVGDVVVDGDTITLKNFSENQYGLAWTNVPFVVGKTYTFSVKNVSKHGETWGWRVLYDNNRIGSLSNALTQTLTVDRGINQLNFYIAYGDIEGTQDIVIEKPMIELSASETDYEPYREGIYQSDADGTVKGVKSLSPSMTLMTDTDGVTMDCSYLRDIDTYIDNLTENIALTGGI